MWYSCSKTVGHALGYKILLLQTWPLSGHSNCDSVGRSELDKMI
ncbi:hypothetical protein Vi05172_g1835 [Venturia inaequalis]|nr:hypothetical protein Vi05172_g1835 [Venturia inaequalis]